MTKENDTAPPSKPVESKQVSENNTEELPQPDTKKTAGKKTAAKKTAAKKTAAKKTSAKKAESDLLPASEVAELLLDGTRRWGTGRDRDTNLTKEGYDLDEVRREVTIARGKRLNSS